MVHHMTKISEELIIRFINNECSDDELRIIEAWVAESPDNAKLLFEMERTACIAGSLADDEKSRNKVASSISLRIENYENMQQRLRRLRILRWSAAAVLVGVIATVSLIFMRPRQRMITIDTYAESKMVILPDSTKVWVNKYSSLTYPEHFAENSRDIELSGEAYFEVTKDSARPFKVKGDYLTVEVLGTKFNFYTTLKKENTVSLIEGKVEVSANSSEDGIVLSPGQKVRFNPENGHMAVTDGRAVLDAVWHNRLIPFSNSTIREIASDLEELYGVDITVRSSVDKNTTYSGVSRLYESVDSTLSALCNTLPISYTRNNQHIIISSRQ